MEVVVDILFQEIPKTFFSFGNLLFFSCRGISFRNDERCTSDTADAVELSSVPRLEGRNRDAQRDLSALAGLIGLFGTEAVVVCCVVFCAATLSAVRGRVSESLPLVISCIGNTVGLLLSVVLGDDGKENAVCPFERRGQESPADR